MELLDALTWNESLPFTIALTVMVTITVLEGAATLIGLSMSMALTEMLDFDAVDADLSGEVGGGGMLSSTLSWLRIGRVPVLISFIVALTLFGLAGVIGQAIMAKLTGHPVNAWIAALVTLFAILPALRAINGWVARLMPDDETEVVSRASFVGHTGEVTLGPVTHSQIGQCRIRDRNGQTQHLMIEPDIKSDTFQIGEKILLVRETGARWRVIAAGRPKE